MKKITFKEKVDLGYYSGYEDVTFTVELTDEEIANISAIIAREKKTKISIIKDEMPDTYEKIYSEWYNLLFDALFYAGKSNWYISFDEISEKDLRKNFENDIKLGNFPIGSNGDMTIAECLEEIESFGVDTDDAFAFWKEHEMEWLHNATTNEIRERYYIDDWIDIDDEYHVCYFPTDLIPKGVEICDDEEEYD